MVGWERAVQAAEAEEDEKSSDMICAQHRGHQRGKGGQRIIYWGTRDVGQVRHQTAGCEDDGEGGGDRGSG